jgi:hypothetical protein
MKSLVASFAGACMLMSANASQAADKVMYQEVNDNKPDVGVSTTVYIGDRMLEQRQGQWQECIVPKFNSVTKWGGVPFRVIDGVPICKSDKNEDRYTPPYQNIFKNISRVKVVSVGLDGVKLCANVMCTEVKDKNNISQGPLFVDRVGFPQKAIEYAGRVGDTVKLVYLESVDAFLHQTVTREFQVDLSQGNVATYKGALIEIENATSSSITYRVVRTF